MFYTPNKKATPAPSNIKYTSDDCHSIKIPRHEAVVGDYVCFLKNIYSGDYVSATAKTDKQELIVGEIVHASHGYIVQKNFYTILLETGKKMVVTNYGLYANGVYRKEWLNEDKRAELLAVKIANNYRS